MARVRAGSIVTTLFVAMGAIALTTGVVLAVAQVSPSNLLPAPAYDRAFAGHAMAALALLPLLLVDPGELAGLPSLHAVAAAMVVGGVVAMAASPDLGDIAMALGVLVFAYAAARSRESPAARATRAVALAWAAVTLLTSAAASMLHAGDDPQPSWIAWLWILGAWRWSIPFVVAIGSTTATATDTTQPWPALAAAAAVAAMLIVGLFERYLLYLVWPAAIALAVIAARTGGEREPFRRWTARLQALVLVEAATTFCFLGSLSPDMYIKDTLFATGAAHLAFLAGALGWLATRTCARRIGRWGLGLVAIGGHVAAFSHLALGSNGTPLLMTEYLDDPPVLQVLHVVAAVAAVTALVGAVAAWLGTRPAQRGPKAF